MNMSEMNLLALEGKSIVITGTLRSYPIRQNAVNAISRLLKAKVVGSISGATAVLIFGRHLEDGRTGQEGVKWKEAITQRERGSFIQFWDDSTFESMLLQAAGLPIFTEPVPVNSFSCRKSYTPLASLVEKRQNPW